MTHKDSEVEAHGVLKQFDTWRFAAAIAVIGFVVMMLFTIKLWDDLDTTVTRLDGVVAARLKEAAASDHETVAGCYASATQAPALRRVLLAIENETVSPSAKADLREFRRLSELNSPTIRECRQLADRLGVNRPKGEGS